MVGTGSSRCCIGARSTKVCDGGETVKRQQRMSSRKREGVRQNEVFLKRRPDVHRDFL